MTALETITARGHLAFNGWSVTAKGKPYLMLSVGDIECEWYFCTHQNAYVDPDLLHEEVEATVAIGQGRNFLQSIKLAPSEARTNDLELLEDLWDASHA
jgi:hypothetical protein